jgi:hypothetical protein
MLRPNTVQLLALPARDGGVVAADFVEKIGGI